MENENNTNTYENSTYDENTTQENTNTYIAQNENVVTIETIHNDLGAIIGFMVFAVVIVIAHYSYKFFNMFFTI